MFGHGLSSPSVAKPAFANVDNAHASKVSVSHNGKVIIVNGRDGNGPPGRGAAWVRPASPRRPAQSTGWICCVVRVASCLHENRWIVGSRREVSHRPQFHPISSPTTPQISSYDMMSPEEVFRDHARHAPHGLPARLDHRVSVRTMA